MRRALVITILLAGVSLSAALLAQPPSAPDPATPPKKSGEADPAKTEDETKKEKRSQHARSLTKIRRGSILRGNQAPDTVIDLRGEHERRRDHEVIRHFTRLAQLDVISKVAGDTGDTLLASEVEAVRREELERFRLAMQHLQWVIRTRMATGLP